MYLLYKNQGESCAEALERLKKLLESGGNPDIATKSMTYAGRLDPLASGVLPILVGDEIDRKNEILELPKTYEFEVVYGISTDTYDQLGIIVPGQEVLSWPTLIFDKELDTTCADMNMNLLDTLNARFKQLKGKVTLAYPFFSSKPIEGIPLFQYVKDHGIEATLPKLPKRGAEIYEIEILKVGNISADELAKESVSLAKKVKGDFRQDEIIASWQKNIAGIKEKTGTASMEHEVWKVRMTVSSGFYIRSFACWLGQMSGATAIARNIVRVKLGSYSIGPNDAGADENLGNFIKI